MYTIFSDDVCIYDDLNNQNEYKLISPSWHQEENTSGSLTFTMPVCNAGYNSVERLKSHIYIYKKGVEVWEGRIISEQIDFNKNRKITCEGVLGYLNDVMQPQREFINPTVEEFLRTIIAYHNEKTMSDKHFTLGQVTVTHPMIDESGEDEYDDDVYVYTNYESTFDCIREKLIDKNTDKYNDKKKDLKGHLRVRKENGVRYIDYLKDYPRKSTQVIDFGVNLLDFAIDYDESEYCTVLIPLGERYSPGEIDGLEGYLDICDVNGGKNYLENTAAVNAFGRIEHVEHFDDIDDEEELYNKGVEYLTDVQFGKMQLNCTALDLSHLNVNADEIYLLDEIRVRSLPHGLDRYFPVTEIEMNLDSPASTNYQMGLKDIVNSNTTMTYYAKTMEVTTKENQKKAENEINEVAADVEELEQETEAKFNVYDDRLEAEVRRATSKETEIYSSVEMTADEIAAEVTRATGEEQLLRSSISITADQIQTEVINRQSSEVELRSSITQTASKIESKVDNGTISSSISQEAGQITLQGGRLVIDSGNFQLDSSGNATATNFTAKDAFKLERGNNHFVFMSAFGEGVIFTKSARIPSTIDYTQLAELMCGTFQANEVWAHDVDADNITSVNDIEADGHVIANQHLVTKNPSTSSYSANVHMTNKGHLAKRSSSSRRWKHDIMTDLGPELDPHKLYDLPVVQFRYNTDYLNDMLDTRYDKPVIGFIAEDVDAIYPIGCDYDEYYLPEDWNYRYIVPPMLKLIQEQHDKILSLEARVSALEGGDNNVS